MEISSRNVVEGTARSPHRAMYKAMVDEQVFYSDINTFMIE